VETENKLVEINTETSKLVAFDPIRLELAKVKKANAERVFDYETPAGEKDARSWVHKLRGTKSKINEIHKTTKQKALAACQLVDSERNECIATIEEMIDVHMKPINVIADRIKAEEQAKVDAIQAAKEKAEAVRLADIKAQEEENERKAKELAKMQADIEAEQKAKQEAIDEAIRKQELAEKAIAEAAEKIEQAEKEAAEIVSAARAVAKKAEQEKATAVQFAKETAEASKQQEAERVQREANIKLQAEKDAREKAEKKEAEHKQDLIDAAAKAEVEERAKAEAEKEEAKRVEREAAEKEAKRVADEKHREKVENVIEKAINDIIGDDLIARNLVIAIVNGEIPHVTINY
jgi:hypothetical protein